MNHPYSQSRASKSRYPHPTTGRPAAFWGTECSACQIIPSLLLLPEVVKNKPCQRALQQSERFVPGLQNWKQWGKVERQRIKVLFLVTALLITPGCWSPLWTLAWLPVQLCSATEPAFPERAALRAYQSSFLTIPFVYKVYKYLRSNSFNFSPFILLRIVEKHAWLYISERMK